MLRMGLPLEIGKFLFLSISSVRPMGVVFCKHLPPAVQLTEPAVRRAFVPGIAISGLNIRQARGGLWGDIYGPAFQRKPCARVAFVVASQRALIEIQTAGSPCGEPIRDEWVVPVGVPRIASCTPSAKVRDGPLAQNPL